MITEKISWTGIWALIIASAVIGRIIEGEGPADYPDIENDPAITREQTLEWTQEFFRSDPHPGTSYLETYGDSNREERGFGQGRSDDLDLQGQGRIPVPSTVKLENLEWMLRNIFTYPRSHSTNSTAKEIVKKYIAESFEFTSGIPTAIQYFKPVQFLSVYDDGDLPIGANVIAVLKGTTWSTSLDRPIVVGAHWDTVNFTPGTDDNGSGVAAMLETARAIAHSGCSLKYSIIFVAFDLEETGSQGSLLFIKEYLVDLLMTSGLSKEMSLEKFQGAFIMDTIMNFNETENSQTFPTDWTLILPEVYDEVANENYRGDFLAVIHRRKADKQLAAKFVHHWKQPATPVASSQNKFNIKPFPLGLEEYLPALEVLSANLNFLRSDHARFWYMNDTEIPRTLNAILITDTGPYRGNMRECYHTVCDGPEISVNNNKANLQFLTKATQTLVDTLIDLSECTARVVTKKESDLYVAANGLPKEKSTFVNSARRSDSPFYMFTQFIKWLQIN